MGSDLGKAYAELHMLKAFHDAIHSATSTKVGGSSLCQCCCVSCLCLMAMPGLLGLQGVLTQLSALFVLATIDEDPVFLRYAFSIRSV